LIHMFLLLGQKQFVQTQLLLAVLILLQLAEIVTAFAAQHLPAVLQFLVLIFAVLLQ